jgi:hypothetical protein
VVAADVKTIANLFNLALSASAFRSRFGLMASEVTKSSSDSEGKGSQLWLQLM